MNKWKLAFKHFIIFTLTSKHLKHINKPCRYLIIDHLVSWAQKTHDVVSTPIRRLYDVLKQRRVSTARILVWRVALDWKTCLISMFSKVSSPYQYVLASLFEKQKAASIVFIPEQIYAVIFESSKNNDLFKNNQTSWSLKFPWYDFCKKKAKPSKKWKTLAFS